MLINFIIGLISGLIVGGFLCGLLIAVFYTEGREKEIVRRVVYIIWILTCILVSINISRSFADRILYEVYTVRYVGMSTIMALVGICTGCFLKYYLFKNQKDADEIGKEAFLWSIFVWTGLNLIGGIVLFM